MALFFLTRVEMHGNLDYRPLHEAMEKQGFIRYVFAANNQKLRLPPAEYAFYGSATSQTTLELAQRTVAPIWANSEILVCEVISWWSVGLTPDNV